MSEEFDVTQGVSGDTDGSGRTEDGGVQGEQGAPEPKLVPETDLHNLRSTLDKKVSVAEQRASQLAQQVEQERQARIKAEAYLGEYAKIAQADPDATALANANADLIARERALADREARIIESQQREAQRQNDIAFYTQQAVAMGVSPTDPALANAAGSGDHTAAAARLAELVKSKGGRLETADKPASPTPDYVPPPAGGRPSRPVSAEQKEVIAAQVLELMKDPNRNAARIAELKKQAGL